MFLIAEFLDDGHHKKNFKVLGIGAEGWGWMVVIVNQVKVASALGGCAKRGVF
jgi:hypothetical protein